jgi:hypothetical protein
VSGSGCMNIPRSRHPRCTCLSQHASNSANSARALILNKSEINTLSFKLERNLAAQLVKSSYSQIRSTWPVEGLMQFSLLDWRV